MPRMEQNKPGVALVLGAGSARGLAHIGVLQVLQENRVPLHLLVGSSMGAMVAATYACGADIHMLGKMVNNIDTGLFFDIKVPRLGFIGGKKINELLQLLTKKKTFAEASPELLVVATDLLQGEEVVLREGSISEAVRASISIPGIFHPVKQEGMVLVDGAVTNRLPVEVARREGAGVIIAVDVTFCEGKQVRIQNTLDVILTSLDILQRPQFEMASKKADVLIQPRVGQYSSRDFEKSAEIIELGRQATQEKLSEILALTHQTITGEVV
mgnify:CR=1 FL=1